MTVREVAERTLPHVADLPTEVTALATNLIRGHRVVETPGQREKGPSLPPDSIILLPPRSLEDYVSAPCKHECNLIREARHARKAWGVFSSLDPARKALMRATAGQCGRDSAHCSHSTVEAVASMGRPASMKPDYASEGTLFCASTLHRCGMPYDYARLESTILLEHCYCCKAPLWDGSSAATHADRIFA